MHHSKFIQGFKRKVSKVFTSYSLFSLSTGSLHLEQYAGSANFEEKNLKSLGDIKK